MIRDCSMSITEMISELADLKDGWLDGDGKAYDRSFLANCETILNRIVAVSNWVPYVYPDCEGCVRAEFAETPFAIIEIWPGDGRISLDIEDVDCWQNVDVEFAANELRRVAHAN